MGLSGNDHAKDGGEDTALRELNRLRSDVAMQEQLVRLLEQRKRERDALLENLRATLARTQPEGFRELHSTAEELVANIAISAANTESTITVPSACGSASPTPSFSLPQIAAEEADEVRVVFNARVEAQLAEVDIDAMENNAATPTAVANSAGAGAVAAHRHLLHLKESRASRHGRRERKGKGHQRPPDDTHASSSAPHVDPAPAPEGFDASKARETQKRLAAEAEAHNARLCALVGDLVAKTGPLPARDPSHVPEWLRDGGEDGCRADGGNDCIEDPESSAAVLVPPSSLRAESERDEEYPDDFEDEDS